MNRYTCNHKDEKQREKTKDMKLGVENHYSRIGLEANDGNNFIKISKIILGRNSRMRIPRRPKCIGN